MDLLPVAANITLAELNVPSANLYLSLGAGETMLRGGGRKLAVTATLSSLPVYEITNEPASGPNRPVSPVLFATKLALHASVVSKGLQVVFTSSIRSNPRIALKTAPSGTVIKTV